MFINLSRPITVLSASLGGGGSSVTVPQNQVILNNLADLDQFVPESGGFRTFQDETNYLLAGDITSSDPFIVGHKMNLTANNQQAPILTYSGTGTMFTGVDASATFNDIRFNCPTAECYNFSTTAGAQNFLLKMTEVVLLTATKYGTFDDLNVLTLNNCSGLNVDDGITLAGNGWTAVDMERMAIISATESITCIDLGTSVHETLNMNRILFGGGVGSVGISGLTNSGNMSVNAVSAVVLCNFLGVATPLNNITISDIRYNFDANEGLVNSTIDADAFLTASRTVPITVQGTYVTIGGANFATDVTERFTVSTGGLITYLPEFNSKIMVIMTATVEKVGGGTDEICAKIAINGTVVDKTISCTENPSPTTVTCLGLFDVANGDTIEGMVANIDATDDIIVSSANISIINGF